MAITRDELLAYVSVRRGLSIQELEEGANILVGVDDSGEEFLCELARDLNLDEGKAIGCAFGSALGSVISGRPEELTFDELYQDMSR